MSDTDYERLKKRAAEYAVTTYVRSGMSIGLGTGSTVYYSIQKIGQLCAENTLQGITCVSTSNATDQCARQCGISIVQYHDIFSTTKLDITIDGADYINSKKQLVKGGGGALTREKIVAYNSQQVIIIADSRKYSAIFACGTVIPLEVMEIAQEAVCCALQAMCHRGKPIFKDVIVRTDPNSSTTYKSDNNNIILDAHLNITIRNAQTLEYTLNSVPGVIENGFFTRGNVSAVIASTSGVRVI